jgi:hypothetical protein
VVVTLALVVHTVREYPGSRVYPAGPIPCTRADLEGNIEVLARPRT